MSLLTWSRRALLAALAGLAAGSRSSGAAGSAGAEGVTVYEYRGLSDWTSLADVIPTINRQFVPAGWQILQFLCTYPERQPAYHVVLRRPKEGAEFQADPTVYEYNYFSNYRDLLEMTGKVSRDMTPEGWQIFHVWWTSSAGTLLWHAITRRPVAR